MGPCRPTNPRRVGHVDTATVAAYEWGAKGWNDRRGSAADDLGSRLRRAAGEGPVADLGCGSGRYLDQLGDPVVGLDATAAMLSMAREAGSTPLVRADLETLPFAEGSFAGAFARHSYLHLPKERAAAAFGELRRILRPGGALLVTFIEGSYEGHGLPGDDLPGRYFAFWQEPELVAALSRARFADVQVERVPRRRAGSFDLVTTARRPG